MNDGQWVAPQFPDYGEELVISCPLEGNPPASYKWNFEKALEGGSYSDVSVPIQPGSYRNITLLNNNRTLYFEEFNEEHNGYYSCYAENFLGNRINYFTAIHVHSK